MPIHIKYLEAFHENEYMHLIAKAVGNNLLFNTDDNKVFFLDLYFKYLEEYVDTYAFCLLDNHVHWLVKCTKENKLKEYLLLIEKDKRKKHQNDFIDGTITFERAIEYQWKDFFISYALAFNIRHKRKGTLFVNPFRRIAIQDEAHLSHLIIYIHANQIKHGIEKNIDVCRFTSYHSIVSDHPTKLQRAEVIELFGGKESFIELHHRIINYYKNQHAMED